MEEAGKAMDTGWYEVSVGIILQTAFESPNTPPKVGASKHAEKTRLYSKKLIHLSG